MTRILGALVLVTLLLCAVFAAQAQSRADIDTALQAALADVGSRAGTAVMPGNYSWVAGAPLNDAKVVANCPAAAALGQNKTYRAVIFVQIDFKANRYQYYFAPDATQLTFCGATPLITPTATFTPVTYTPTPSITPTLTGTPRPGAITCPGFMPSRLAAGEQGRAVAGNTLNLREQPQTNAPVIRPIYDTQTFRVLSGPNCDAAGRAWWQVQASSSTGWMVEGEGNLYYAEPLSTALNPVGATPTSAPNQPSLPTPTLPPTSTLIPTLAPTALKACPGGSLVPRLTVHTNALVVAGGNANNVRDLPASNGKLLGQIPPGASFGVLAGPSCDYYGRAWWQVNYNGLTGWTVEGDNNEYYLEPLH